MSLISRGRSPWLVPQTRVHTYLPIAHVGIAQRFRPYLKFSYDENHEHNSPCSWQWFYERSQLTTHGAGSRIGTDYSKVLAVSDIRKDNCDTDAVILIDDDAQSGQAWQEVVNGSGIYCHASNVGSEFVNLEYWLLFGFNRASVHTLDHKGDVVCIQIVYSIKYDRICRAAFVIHGKVVEAFDVPTFSPSNSGYSSLVGIDLNKNKISEQAIRVDVPKDYQYQDGPAWHSPSKPRLFFTKDETSEKYEHIVAFIEHGTHEPWPNKTGHVDLAPNHNGKSYSFLPSSVTLLNKAADAPFYYFGGRFGDPAGLMRHRTWYLESDDAQVQDAIRVDENPYQNMPPLLWPPTAH